MFIIQIVIKRSIEGKFSKEFIYQFLGIIRKLNEIPKYKISIQKLLLSSVSREPRIDYSRPAFMLTTRDQMDPPEIVLLKKSRTVGAGKRYVDYNSRKRVRHGWTMGFCGFILRTLMLGSQASWLALRGCMSPRFAATTKCPSLGSW